MASSTSRIFVEEIISLNADDLDVEELERRLEFSPGATLLDGCGAYCTCNGVNCTCNGLCYNNCGSQCAANCTGNGQGGGGGCGKLCAPPIG